MDKINIEDIRNIKKIIKDYLICDTHIDRYINVQKKIQKKFKDYIIYFTTKEYSKNTIIFYLYITTEKLQYQTAYTIPIVMNKYYYFSEIIDMGYSPIDGDEESNVLTHQCIEKFRNKLLRCMKIKKLLNE